MVSLKNSRQSNARCFFPMLIGVLGFLCGCVSDSTSVDAKQRLDGLLGEGYNFHQTSGYEIIQQTEKEWQVRVSELNMLREKAKNDLALSDYIAKRIGYFDAFYGRLIKRQNAFYTKILRPSDQILRYVFDKDSYHDDGMVVVRNGRIVFRMSYCYGNTECFDKEIQSAVNALDLKK